MPLLALVDDAHRHVISFLDWPSYFAYATTCRAVHALFLSTPTTGATPLTIPTTLISCAGRLADVIDKLTSPSSVASSSPLHLTLAPALAPRWCDCRTDNDTTIAGSSSDRHSKKQPPPSSSSSSSSSTSSSSSSSSSPSSSSPSIDCHWQRQTSTSLIRLRAIAPRLRTLNAAHFPHTDATVGALYGALWDGITFSTTTMTSIASSLTSSLASASVSPLTALDLTGWPVTLAHTRTLVATLAPTLRSLTLADCETLTDEMVTVIASLTCRGSRIAGDDDNATTTEPSLNKLDLSGTRITDAAVATLALQSQPPSSSSSSASSWLSSSLTSLNLSRCRHLTDAACKSLQTLVWPPSSPSPLYFASLSLTSPTSSSSSSSMSSLSSLSLNGVLDITDVGILALCSPSSPSSTSTLHTLELSSNRNISDISVAAIAAAFAPTLSSLRLSGCVGLSRRALLELASPSLSSSSSSSSPSSSSSSSSSLSMRQLTTLNLSWCQMPSLPSSTSVNHNDVGIDVDDDDCHQPLRRLGRTLTSLNLSNAVFGESLLDIVTSCPHLRTLHLCHHRASHGDIDDDTAGVLSALQSLTTLSLGPGAIGHKGLAAIALSQASSSPTHNQQHQQQPQHTLQHLDLSHAFASVTDHAIAVIGTHFQRLRTLNLSGCFNITDAALLSLCTLSSLTRLRVSLCHQISSSALVVLVRALCERDMGDGADDGKDSDDHGSSDSHTGWTQDPPSSAYVRAPSAALRHIEARRCPRIESHITVPMWRRYRVLVQVSPPAGSCYF